MADDAIGHIGAGRLLAGIVVDAARLTQVVSALDGADIELHRFNNLAAAANTIDEASLDVMITDATGADGQVSDTLRRLLARRVPPVVVIATTNVGGVEALEAGAADYVVEPFAARELRARTVLRGTTLTRSKLEYGKLVINRVARRVSVGGCDVRLTAREYSLLLFLAERPGRVIARDALLEIVWDASPRWRSLGTVTEHIYRLRRKIEPDPQRPRWITTVRGAGYRFDA